MGEIGSGLEEKCTMFDDHASSLQKSLPLIEVRNLLIKSCITLFKWRHAMYLAREKMRHKCCDIKTILKSGDILWPTKRQQRRQIQRQIQRQRQ